MGLLNYGLAFLSTIIPLHFKLNTVSLLIEMEGQLTTWRGRICLELSMWHEH
jgi:hypothetical protein